MPKITQAGPSIGPADAHVVATDDPDVQRTMDQRQATASAAEAAHLRRENRDLQQRLDDATISQADRDKAATDRERNDASDGDADGPKPSKVAGGANADDTEDDGNKAKASTQSGTFQLNDDSKSGNKSSNKPNSNK